MRRAEREITDPAQIAAFLAQEQILRVGFYDNGEIYIVPVNYGYTCENGRYTFYFHGASAGRKYELAQHSPRVGFEIDGNYAPLPHETACGYSAKYTGIIGTGILEIIRDDAEKRAGLDCIMRQVTGKIHWEYTDTRLHAVTVFRLTADKLTCKGK